MGRKRILSGYQAERFSNPLTDHIPVNQIQAFSQGFIFFQGLLVAFIRDLKNIRKCGVGQG